MSNHFPTVLVVDDEESIRRMLRRALGKEKFTVLEAKDGTEMHQHLASGKVDLITLDLSLETEDGLQLARELRAKDNTPIIIVSGKGELIDTVVGLELGADDYVSKPFEIRELIARIRAVLRRYQKDNNTENQNQPAQAETTSAFSFLGWTLNTATRELRDPEQQICELTTGEFDLLYVLVSHPRQTMTRDQIMDNLRGMEWSPNDRTIDNQVVRLRKKLHSDKQEGELIKTVRGSGYLFTPDVTVSS